MFYIEAIELANSVSGERTAEEEMAYDVLFAEVGELLDAAEKDLIDVTDLRVEFGYVETANPANAVPEMSSRI